MTALKNQNLVILGDMAEVIPFLHPVRRCFISQGTAR
jgi:hypothetical protein